VYAQVPIRHDLRRAVVQVLRLVRRDRDRSATSVVFDVSRALALDEEAEVLSVMIEPRHPLRPRRHLWLDEFAHVEVAHVLGGHNALGHELVPLEEDALRRLADRVAPGCHLVITAAGSQGNKDHERRAADILRSVSPPASIAESSTFHSENLLVREYTAVVNALLLASAERLASDLSDAVADAVGDGARVYVATNEGGCTPLSRLPITPVHAFRADAAGEVLGAAALGGRATGRVIVARDDSVRVAEFFDGLPAVVNRFSAPGGVLLASSFAQVSPLTDLLLTGSAEPPLTVLAAGAEEALDAFGLTPAAITDEDLIALGAAVAPMTYWYNRVVTVQSPAELDEAFREGERRARANLIASGADPADVRIAESRVFATTYGEAQMVRIRVRGVASTAPSPLERSAA
jgi:hypothetical protein